MDQRQMFGQPAVEMTFKLCTMKLSIQTQCFGVWMVSSSNELAFNVNRAALEVTFLLCCHIPHVMGFVLLLPSAIGNFGPLNLLGP